MADEALQEMSTHFVEIYGEDGCTSIQPERRGVRCCLQLRKMNVIPMYL
jgi:hypothetical protein